MYPMLLIKEPPVSGLFIALLRSPFAFVVVENEDFWRAAPVDL